MAKLAAPGAPARIGKTGSIFRETEVALTKAITVKALEELSQQAIAAGDHTRADGYREVAAEVEAGAEPEDWVKSAVQSHLSRRRR
jgi:hypothetical protein